jgi:hypothetical protein
MAHSDEQPATGMSKLTVAEILNELGPYTGKFPREALRAAIEQREAIISELIRLVETIAADPGAYAAKGERMLPVFALYLLAQLREERTYPAVVKIFHAPGETAYELVGDTVTCGLHRIFASIYDGNPAPLQELIEDEAADEFVRDAGIRALLVLEKAGRISRSEVVEYFRSLFQGKLERRPSFAWDGLVAAVGDLPAPELLEEVRWAYDEGLADPGVVGFKDIERDLARLRPSGEERELLITDAIGEMENWACFHEEGSGMAEALPVANREPMLGSTPPSEQATYQPPEPAKPFVREEPKVGRNDPCPCGSGKKYKKCCGS